ncbi:MAG TPA: methylated-DNA--[protein]-cysteine S-methyltransferase [Propionibacteriaceae bacterium]|nr:methylated-DNA--[protein]-cysteine S-methyltransferase [Propionibacteriaceae bacterium]
MTNPLNDEALLQPLAASEPETLDRLQQRLVRSAAQLGLLDVAYRTLDTPVGTLLLAATPIGLARVAYAREDHAAVLADLAVRISPRLLQEPSRLDGAARQLDEYFSGRRREFDLPLDLSLVGGFRREVLEQLRQISYGSTASYTALAARSGRPRAVRAAASACARNPLPVVVPCHRIVRSDHSLGGYIGGLDVKQRLLALEHAD